MTTTAAATRKAAGTAQRGKNRMPSSQTAMTGRTPAGFATAPVMGARHSWRSTPASIACATEVGMRAMSAPSGGMRPVRTMSSPATRKAPTAAGQPPSTAPVVTRSAAPGVDHATVMGMRVHPARMTVPTPMRTVTAMSPLDACAVVAPTAVSPVRTTTNELVDATRDETTPAVRGWARVRGSYGKPESE